MSRETFDMAEGVAHVALPRTVPNKNMLIYGLFVQDSLLKEINEQQWLTGCSAENMGQICLFERLTIFTRSVIGSNQICLPLAKKRICVPYFVVEHFIKYFENSVQHEMANNQ